MDMYDIDFVSVGKHGVTLEEKLKESAERVVNLADLISGENFDVALSKHSIELPRVAFGLGIPSLFVLDNEHAIKSMLAKGMAELLPPEVLEDVLVYPNGEDSTLDYSLSSKN